MNLSRKREDVEMAGTDRFMLANVVAGLVLGFVVAAAIIILDVHGIGTLLRNSDQTFVAAVLLTAGFGSLAAAGLFSTAMAFLPSHSDETGGNALEPVLAPVHRRA
jgi:hypothetical protein